MKKKILIIALVVIAVVVALVLFLKPQGAKIIVATDTHYLSSRINDGGEAFQNMNNNADGKITQYCDEIFSAFSDEVIEKKPDVLILSGDLSFNGEKASHEDFAKKLKEIQDNGVQVLTIAGNHDINVKNSAQYKGSEYLPTESVTAEEFKNIYFDFGMKQAESVDEYSLSYMYKVNKSLYVLMLDTNAFGQNFVQDPSYPWIGEQLKMAKSKRAKVVTVTHQNLYAHNDRLSFGYALYDADELLELLNKYKVKCNLSGHIHMQHIVEDSVTDIATSSLMVNTTQYGEIDFDGSIHYETRRVDVEKWARKNNIDNADLLDFSNYSVDFFMSSGRLTNTLDDLGLTENERNEIFNAVNKLNSSYFAGTKIDTSDIMNGVELCRKQEGFLSTYIDSLLSEAENDYTKIDIK